VGGIGIMNIMLASVTERTKEIGIRRAIGARRSRIIVQFLINTCVLSLGGGIVGVILGTVIPFVITLATGMPTVIRPYSLILAFGISATIGIVFGLYRRCVPRLSTPSRRFGTNNVGVLPVALFVRRMIR
jgi:putative ABC transport system permease protein